VMDASARPCVSSTAVHPPTHGSPDIECKQPGLGSQVESATSPQVVMGYFAPLPDQHQPTEVATLIHKDGAEKRKREDSGSDSPVEAAVFHNGQPSQIVAESPRPARSPVLQPKSLTLKLMNMHDSNSSIEVKAEVLYSVLSAILEGLPDRRRTVTQGNLRSKEVRRRISQQVADDGYKWRKYGTKIVKPNRHHNVRARDYYRCKESGCTARKQVELDGENNIVGIKASQHSCGGISAQTHEAYPATNIRQLLSVCEAESNQGEQRMDLLK